MQRIQAVVDEPGLDALARMNRMHEASREWQASNVELVMTILKVMYQDENLLLRYRIQERSREQCVPVFSKIIAQGIQEGVFDADSPEEIGEMILRLGNSLTDTTIGPFLELREKPENLKLIERKIELYQQAIDAEVAV